MKSANWTCLFCQKVNNYIDSVLLREQVVCRVCGSTWRERALVLNLLEISGVSEENYLNRNLDFSIKILGIGDSYRVSAAFGGRFKYVNSFLDEFPIIDLEGQKVNSPKFKFVTCSDVLEHVFNLDKALEGLKYLTASGGRALVTVPISTSIASSIEHYPDIRSYEIVDNCVSWKDSTGVEHLEMSPIFHGGDARTLEIRQIELNSFKAKLSGIGISYKYQCQFNDNLGVPQIQEDHGFFILTFD